MRTYGRGSLVLRCEDGRGGGLVLLWRRALMGLLLCSFASSGVADYVDEWGPAIGSRLPPLQAPDETGAERTLSDLYGGRGLILVLNRSADW